MPAIPESQKQIKENKKLKLTIIFSYIVSSKSGWIHKTLSQSKQANKQNKTTSQTSKEAIRKNMNSPTKQKHQNYHQTNGSTTLNANQESVE